MRGTKWCLMLPIENSRKYYVTDEMPRVRQGDIRQGGQMPHCGAPNPNYDPDTPKPAELYTPCSKHPDKKSVLRCSACGKEMCSACGTNSKTFEGGEVLCPECYLEFLKKMNHDSKKDHLQLYSPCACCTVYCHCHIFSYCIHKPR